MANLVEPILRTRLTDMTAPVFSFQMHPCKEFEMRYVSCMEAYGKSLGKEKCMDLKLDLNECVFSDKQVCLDDIFSSKLQAHKINQ